MIGKLGEGLIFGQLWRCRRVLKNGLPVCVWVRQIDARFVPDDTSFEGREVRDQADHVPSTYGTR